MGVDRDNYYTLYDALQQLIIVTRRIREFGFDADELSVEIKKAEDALKQASGDVPT